MFRRTKQGCFWYDDNMFFNILNPFYIARRGLKRAIESVKLDGKVLDVGAGSQPYKYLYKDYTSLEIEGKQADFNYTIRFPFGDKVFDSVLCTQVLEHVSEPNSFLSEIGRVTKGKILITCPLMWNEHEQPRDYMRYTSFGLRNLLLKNNFKIVEQRKIGGDLSAVFQLINVFIYSLTCNKRWTRIMGKIICVPFTLVGLSLSWIKTDDFYLDNLIVAE